MFNFVLSVYLNIITVMKNAAQKFTYTGYHDTTFTVEAYGRKLYIEQVDGKFEVNSEGGWMASFRSFGKAVSYAEKQIVTMHKNND